MYISGHFKNDSFIKWTTAALEIYDVDKNFGKSTICALFYH